MIIKPAAGLKVRHPISRVHIPESGLEVSDTDPYWARKLADGDVVVVQVQPPTVEKKPSKGQE